MHKTHCTGVSPIAQGHTLVKVIIWYIGIFNGASFSLPKVNAHFQKDFRVL